MSKPKIICIMGETASGKDSITKAAIEKMSNYEIREVCSYTDRPKRENETDGIEHYFVSTYKFNKLKSERRKDLLAYTRIKKKDNPKHPGYQYMAFNDELEKSHIYIIDPQGLQFLKEKYSDKVDIVSVYIFASLETRLNRASTRSDFDKEFKNRVEAETEQFDYFRNHRLYDYKIDNNKDDSFENAVNRLCVILEYELINADISNFVHIVKPQKTNS